MDISAATAPERSTIDPSQSEGISKKPSHRERLTDFIKFYKEFESEETLHRYYLAYEGPDCRTTDDEDLIQFWREVL